MNDSNKMIIFEDRSEEFGPHSMRYYEDHQYALNKSNIPIMQDINVLVLWKEQEKLNGHKLENSKVKKRSQKKSERKPLRKIEPKVKVVCSDGNAKLEGSISPNAHRIQKKFVESLQVQDDEKRFGTSVRIENGKIAQVNGESTCLSFEPLLSDFEVSELFDETLFDNVLV